MELKTKINKFLKFTSLRCLIVTLNNQEFLVVVVVVVFFGEIVILVVIGSNFNTFKFNVTNKHN